MGYSGDSSNDGPFIDIALDFNVQHNIHLNPAYVLIDMSMADWPNGYHRNVTICSWWTGIGSDCPKEALSESRARFQNERIYTKDLDSPAFAMRWAIWTSDLNNGPLVFCMNGLVPQSQPRRRDERAIDAMGSDGHGGKGAAQDLR